MVALLHGVTRRGKIEGAPVVAWRNWNGREYAVTPRIGAWRKGSGARLIPWLAVPAPRRRGRPIRCGRGRAEAALRQGQNTPCPHHGGDLPAPPVATSGQEMACFVGLRGRGAVCAGPRVYGAGRTGRAKGASEAEKPNGFAYLPPPSTPKTGEFAFWGCGGCPSTGPRLRRAKLRVILLQFACESGRKRLISQ